MHIEDPDPKSFQLDLPPLQQGAVPEGLQALAAATVWLALGTVGLGLVGGIYLGV